MAADIMLCSITVIREFKQITTAGATTAAVTEKVWGVRLGGLPHFSKAKYRDVGNMNLRV